MSQYRRGAGKRHRNTGPQGQFLTMLCRQNQGQNASWAVSEVQIPSKPMPSAAWARAGIWFKSLTSRVVSNFTFYCSLSPNKLTFYQYIVS
jgi:hypothetical protein